MTNLDLKCAEFGHKLAELQVNARHVDEKVFTAALGVLEEQGPYACFLYLNGRQGQAGKKISVEAARFLSEALPGQEQGNDALALIKNIADDLDLLLFARDSLRHAFVYARYHAKAREGTGGPK